MPVRVVCPSCATQLNVKDELAGRAVKCPKCGSVIPPTQAAAPPAAPPAPAAPPPVRPQPPAFEEVDAPAAPPKPRTRPVAEVDEDDADAPRRPRRPRDEDDDRRRPGRPRPRRRDDDDDADWPAKKSNLPLILGIIAGVLLLCCGGVGYGVYWFMNKAKETVVEFAESMKPKNDKVTRANYDKLTEGMTRAQAEGVLGTGRQVSAVELSFQFPPANRARVGDWSPLASQNRVLVWQNGDDHILAAFSAPAGAPNAKLVTKTFQPATGPSAEQRFPSFRDAVEAPQAAGTAVEVPAVDLGKAYQDDPTAADAKYKDKTLLVEGKLSDITPRSTDLVALLEGPPAPAGEVIGTLVLCQFDTNAARPLWSLSRGQSVKIRGKCLGGSKSSVTLIDCKFESAGQDPSVRVTATGLILEATRDATGADVKYKDKSIFLTSAIVESKEEAALILVGTSKKAPTVKIKATWPFDARKQLDAIKVGDRVQIKGEYGGSSDGTISLNRCWLIPSP